MTSGRAPVGLPAVRGKWPTGQLFHVEPEPPRLDQKFGRERRAAGVNGHALPDPAAEQLEGAVDVAGGVAEQQVDQQSSSRSALSLRSGGSARLRRQPMTRSVCAVHRRQEVASSATSNCLSPSVRKIRSLVAASKPLARAAP